MAHINNSLIPLVIGDNLNDIILGYKFDTYNKILSTIKRQKKYYLSVVDEITNIDICNKMNKIVDELTDLIISIEFMTNKSKYLPQLAAS